MREYIFKARYWDFQETGSETIINVVGRTRTQKTIFVKVINYQPYVFVELPPSRQWTNGRVKDLFLDFKRLLGKFGPVSYQFNEKKNLFHEKKMLCAKFYMPSHNACQMIAKKCHDKKGVDLENIGHMFDLQIHEQNIDPIIKMTALKKINLAGWLSCKETIPEDEEGLSVEDRKFADTDICLVCDVKDLSLKTLKNEPFIKWKVLSFDIEQYSKNHNSKMPDSNDIDNFVYQISAIFYQDGDKPGEWNEYLLTLYDPPPIDHVKIIKFDTEANLILGFSKLIVQENPDDFLGYNILKYDWDTLITRANMLGIYQNFSKMTRILGHKAERKSINWNSSAYSDQVMYYPDTIGRTQIDVRPEIERNYRFPSYNLNMVAKLLIKDEKVDLPAKQTFMLVYFTMMCWPLVLQVTPSSSKKTKQNKPQPLKREDVLFIKKQAKSIFKVRQISGETKELRKRVIDMCNEIRTHKDIDMSMSEDLVNLVKEAIHIIGVYCMQDSRLSIRIEDRINMRTNMEQMANIWCVPMSYLHTRGQQIKVMSQLFRELLVENFIIPFTKNKDNVHEKYQGAMVVEANPGDYQNVATLDFASLYPSMMIAFNICFTTLMKDDDPIPDEKCHILEWDDHVGCVHDVLKRKKNKDKILCKVNRLRFRKREVLPDGTVLHEGKMPRLVKNLLKNRKIVKTEMEKCEARLQMNRGKATEKDLEKYKKYGYDIIEVNSLPKEEDLALELICRVLNAKQLALKTSANSVVPNTPVPCKVDNVFQYRTIEELSLGDWTSERDSEGDQEFSSPIPNLLVWSDVGFTQVKYVMRHKLTESDKLVRVNTHMGTVVCTQDHSLLKKNGEEISPMNISYDDDLMHRHVEDIQCENVYPHGIEEVVKNYDNLSTIDQAKLFLQIHQMGYFPHFEKVENDKVKLFIGNSKIQNNKLICLENVVEKYKYEYVYDIETVSHHFAAGVGDLIVHNSAYGGFGAVTGYFPCIPCAASVTAMGRKMIVMAIDYIKEKYKHMGIKLVYGDSVSHDTPILCKLDDRVFYISIEDLYENYSIPFMNDEKEMAQPYDGLLVWSDKGFTPIKTMIRHKTEKEMYRVVTHTGVVDVTEDHSLLDEDGGEISTRDVNVGDTLLHHDLPTLTVGKYGQCSHDNITWENVLQSCKECQRVFLGTPEGCKIPEGCERGESTKVHQAIITLLKYNLGLVEITNDDNKIKKITSLGKCSASAEYVYDLETDNHHFAAGVGRMVVHNTDSCMICFPSVNDLKECFKLAKTAGRAATHYLICYSIGIPEDYTILIEKDNQEFYKRLDEVKDSDVPFIKHDKDKVKKLEYDMSPIDLEFEDMSSRFFLLTKKRYSKTTVNEDGKVLKEVDKGTLLVRRDRAPVERTPYKDIIKSIKDNLPEADIKQIPIDHIIAMYTRQVPQTHYIIYVGISKLIDYTVTKKAMRNGKEDKMHVLVDGSTEWFDAITDPSDVRLVFKKLPQAMLARKLMMRGEIIPPNTRLEYIYIENDEAGDHLGDYAEDYTFFHENGEMIGLKINKLLYISRMVEPINELLNVKFPQPKVYCVIEKFVASWYLKDQNLSFEGVDNDKLSADKIRKIFPNDGILDAIQPYIKEVLEKDMKPNEKITFVNLELGIKYYIQNMKNEYLRHQVNQRRKINEKVDFILQSNRSFKNNKLKWNVSKITKKGKTFLMVGKPDDNKAKHAMLVNENDDKELIEICLRWKSLNVLKRLYKMYGLKNSPSPRQPRGDGCSSRWWYHRDEQYMEVLLHRMTYAEQVIKQLYQMSHEYCVVDYEYTHDEYTPTNNCIHFE